MLRQSFDYLNINVIYLFKANQGNDYVNIC